MAGRGSAPGERRGGRQKGTPNKVTVKRAAAIAESGKTPLDFMLSVLRDEDASIKERMWAAVAAAPYCHAKPRPVAANAGGVEVQVVHITHEQRLAELDALGDPSKTINHDTQGGSRIKEPATALVADPAPCETMPPDRQHGNGAHNPLPGNGASQAPQGGGADVHRGHARPRDIRARPRGIRDYPATHPVHGIV